MNLDRVIAVRNDKTVYRDGDKCIKVFNSQYGKADVLSEAFNQARIEEIGVAVPKFISVSMIEDKWAITSEYVKGKTLARLLQENPEKILKIFFPKETAPSRRMVPRCYWSIIFFFHLPMQNTMMEITMPRLQEIMRELNRAMG